MKDVIRCPWCLTHPLLREYHDTEWGVLKMDDPNQFEHLLLETFQAGLSWLTILKRREAFRNRFACFDPNTVAGFDGKTIDELLTDPEIIRSRSKIEAAVINAGQFLQVSREFGSFYRFLAQFEPSKAVIYNDDSQIPAQIQESVELAKEMKRRGFKFIGPVSMYAHMQSVGIVNDHIAGCYRHSELRLVHSRSL